MPADTIWFEIFLIFILILANGFFAGAEIAIISARRGRIEQMAKEGKTSAEVVKNLKDNPDRFLATVQIGITIVGSLAAAIGGVTAIEFLKPVIQNTPLHMFSDAIAIGIVVLAISYVTLIIGELVPKSLGLRYAEGIACFSAMPIDFLSRVSSFFVKILTASTNIVLKLFGAKGLEERAFVSEEEIKYFVKEGREKGIFEETEQELIHGVFDFADTTVREIMTPKHKFSAIDIDMPEDKVLEFITETGFSRYPVYKEEAGHIIGVLYNKDVFTILKEKRQLILKDIIRAPYFVPDTIMISKLLRDLQRKRMHMAIVINEHGDVDGLVTIEDLLEEIVGEIEDEYDIEKGGLIEKLKDGTMIVDASISIRDLKDVGLPFEDTEEFHTLAGFMLSKLQKLPRGGEFVSHMGYRFTVVDVEGKRIVKVKVEPLPQEMQQVKV
ncbi:MAG: HlyC/CorC family transporter [Deltaproteobacteria bacterium]|nr:HlyC/CorC family transporter [Deltaproteobacteria bacterium]